MNRKFDKIESFVYLNSIIQHLDDAGIELNLYIDSSDVISMLQGLRCMVNEQQMLNFKKYQSTSTLIYSLLYNKWLGKGHLALPHQEELYSNLATGDLDFSKVEEDSLQEFWSNVVNQTLGIKSSDFEADSPKEVLIKKLAPKSEELYKANYLLRQIEWKRKFKHLLSENILEFDRAEEDLLSIAKSDLFRRLLEGFNKIRRDQSSKNNITDATVLCILHRRLTEYKASNSIYLPIIYPDNLFHKVLKITGLNDEFSIEIGQGKFSILVNEDFLLYYALFKNKHKMKSLNDDQLDAYADYSHLTKLISDQKQIGKFISEYNKRIKSFVESRFLQLCWVYSKEEIHEFVEELIRLNQKELRSKENKALLDEEVELMLNDIKDSVERFSIFKEIYDTISSARFKIVRMFTDNLMNSQKTDNFDIMNGLSLIRFSTPDEYADQVNKLARLLFIKTPGSETFVITTVVENVLSVLRKKQSESIVVSILILWIIEKFDLIDRIFKTFDGNYPHFSEGFIHASALSRIMGEDDGYKIRAILRNIDQADSQNEFKSNYKTSIAASYVYFHLWIKEFDGTFRTLLKEPQSSRNIEIQGLFDKALECVEDATELMQNLNDSDKDDRYKRAKSYYVLNNKIYFVTMGSDDTKFFKLSDDVARLEDLETNHPELWEYRYHDTLALYYVRRAVNAKRNKNKSKFDSYLDEAKDRISKGLATVYSVNDERDFRKLQRRIEVLSFEDDMPV